MTELPWDDPESDPLDDVTSHETWIKLHTASTKGTRAHKAFEEVVNKFSERIKASAEKIEAINTDPLTWTPISSAGSTSPWTASSGTYSTGGIISSGSTFSVPDDPVDYPLKLYINGKEIPCESISIRTMKLPEERWIDCVPLDDQVIKPPVSKAVETLTADLAAKQAEIDDKLADLKTCLAHIEQLQAEIDDLKTKNLDLRIDAANGRDRKLHDKR